MKNLLVLLAIFGILQLANAKTPKEKISQEERLEWFQNAKLGVFIHWGIYGVNGISASWSMYHKKISYKDYMKQLDGFTAAKYDPSKWAKLFKDIGARYAVMTSKHHDGVALWDTKYSKLNVVKKSPAGRDLVEPYVNALRKEGLKVGLYFSICDWAHPDYDVVFPRPNTSKNYPQKNQKYLSKWQRFIKFYKGQLKELDTRYKPDLWWFDGDWEKSAEQWRAQGLKDSLLKWNSRVVINSRLKQYGDYATPEQGVPVLRPEGVWEFCMTMNRHWGYHPSDKKYKTISEIIRTFVDVISNGGNLLLNIGPKPDGTIAKEQRERLVALGKWIRKHKEAVFSTTAGVPFGHFYGPTLVGKDKKTLYLCLFHNPKNYILLKGLYNKIKSIEVVGNNTQLDFVLSGGAAWKNIPGIVRISVPAKKDLDKYVTIIKLNFEDELKLYRGQGNIP